MEKSLLTPASFCFWPHHTARGILQLEHSSGLGSTDPKHCIAREVLANPCSRTTLAHSRCSVNITNNQTNSFIN